MTDHDHHDTYIGVILDSSCDRCAEADSLVRLTKDEFARLWDLTYRVKVGVIESAAILSSADAAYVMAIWPVQVMLERFGWPLGTVPELTQAARVMVAGRSE